MTAEGRRLSRKCLKRITDVYAQTHSLVIAGGPGTLLCGLLFPGKHTRPLIKTPTSFVFVPMTLAERRRRG